MNIQRQHNGSVNKEGNGGIEFMKYCFSVVLLLAFSLCSATPAGTSAESAFDLGNLDNSVAACTDFYQYADGGWMAKNPIPAAYPRWGTFDQLQERNQEIVHQILEPAAKDASAPQGSNEQKIGDFYGSCMDEKASKRQVLPRFNRSSTGSKRSTTGRTSRAQLRGCKVLASGFYFAWTPPRIPRTAAR